MSTYYEFQELLDNCNVTWIDDYNGTGTPGNIFTSMINGNSVFLPAAGYCDGSDMNYIGSFGFYWATSLYSSSDALAFGFYSGDQVMGHFDRYYGLLVRGVCE